MSNTHGSIGLALPKEMARVRDELMPQYIAIGTPGLFALTMMRHELDAAAKAMAEGDTIGMIRCYQTLKEFTS